MMSSSALPPEESWKEKAGGAVVFFFSDPVTEVRHGLTGPVTAHLEQPCGERVNGSSLLQFRCLLSAPVKATLSKAEYDFPGTFRPIANPV